MTEFFLIWLDILGFEKLASELSEKSGITERKVRSEFISILNEKIIEAKNKGEILGVNHGAGDNWLLVANSVDSVFKFLYTILDFKTDYKYCEHIPLELALGYKKYDKEPKIESYNFIAENATIDFLKSNILQIYRDWFKSINKESIKSSFIISGSDFYEKMEYMDKLLCSVVEYDNKHIFNYDLLKATKRGKFLKFLTIINKPPFSPYRRVDDLFISPLEFQEILKKLENFGLVFIVGDPEIGKTYTAIRILWEYYCKGFKPIYYSGSEYEDRKMLREKISGSIDFKDNTIIYFEDPFGKLIYEDREELRRNIGNFIEKIKGSNSKILITSRYQIFTELKRVKIAENDFVQLEAPMFLMHPSYNQDKMKEILYAWALNFDCKWLQNEELKDQIFEIALKNLKTPLSINDFALASRNCFDYNSINTIIIRKSKEVSKAFAEEISNIAKEKILFLNLFYILNELKLNDIEQIYINQYDSFDLNSAKYPFKSIMGEFLYKISINQYRQTPSKFTHPSYEEGLVTSWNIMELTPFMLKIFNKLKEDSNPLIRGLCGFCLIKNYSFVSFKSEIKEIIDKILLDKSAITRYGIAFALELYFRNIPIDLGLEYMHRIQKDRNREIRTKTIEIVKNFFQIIPFQTSLEFLYKGLDDKAARVRLEAVGTVRQYIESLPKELIYKALKCNRDLCDYTGWLISYFAYITYSDFEEKVNKLIKK